ncbi:MAG: glycosyltransferase family 2 protein [Blautia sp.]|nr:glycosyltransferase family 2 protein [Blautia sp.]
MCEKKVSLVVPVYNAGHYLEKCLSSIANQSYRNIEAILVDDGSTDGSGAVCDRFSCMDDRFIVIHQENEGVAAAYNKCLAHVTGDFVVIVDNDDYLDPSLLSELLLVQTESGADFVQGGYFFVSEDETLIKKTLFGNRTYQDKSQMVWDYLVTGKISHTMTGALIRARLFDGVSFPEKAMSGDVQVIPQLLHRCDSYVQVNEAYYYVTVRFDSVSRSFATDAMYWDKHACTRFYEDFIQTYYPDFGDFILYRKTSVAVLLYTRTVKNNRISDVEEKKAQCIREFKDNYPNLRKSRIYSSLPDRAKLRFHIFKVSPRLLKLLEGLYTRLLIKKQRK